MSKTGLQETNGSAHVPEGSGKSLAAVPGGLSGRLSAATMSLAIHFNCDAEEQAPRIPILQDGLDQLGSLGRAFRHPFLDRIELRGSVPGKVSKWQGSVCLKTRVSRDGRWKQTLTFASALGRFWVSDKSTFSNDWRK